MIYYVSLTKISQLPVRSVQYEDVLEMFGLAENLEEIWTLQQHDIYNPSDTMSELSSFSNT